MKFFPILILILFFPVNIVHVNSTTTLDTSNPYQRSFSDIGSSADYRINEIIDNDRNTKLHLYNKSIVNYTYSLETRLSFTLYKKNISMYRPTSGLDSGLVEHLYLNYTIDDKYRLNDIILRNMIGHRDSTFYFAVFDNITGVQNYVEDLNKNVQEFSVENDLILQNKFDGYIGFVKKINWKTGWLEYFNRSSYFFENGSLQQTYIYEIVKGTETSQNEPFLEGILLITVTISGLALGIILAQKKK